MANDEHVAQLKKGVAAWNTWRRENPIRPNLYQANLIGLWRHEEDRNVRADLREANLREANLSEANLRGAILSKAYLSRAYLREASLSEAILWGADVGGANLNEADLSRADLDEANLRRASLTGAVLTGANLGEANLVEAVLRGANLSGASLGGANLRQADLIGAVLTGANLVGVNLGGANLNEADLRGANLCGAKLRRAQLVDTNFTGADLTGCHIFGISAWRLKLDRAKQQNLVITSGGEPEITVDNIEVAQFIYLLLHNEKIRDVIDTVGRKGVLLLGRFTEGRIAVLERLREELRKRDFLPIIFNFDKPETKNFTETVRLLVGMSRFVIVDITNPRSAPLELQATVPECMVPFVPILDKNDEEKPFAMLRDLQIAHRDRVFDVIRYPSVDRLIEVLDTEIINPAQVRFAELLALKAEGARYRDI
jgi:uncharacterized protein YjbI with pentapeptide repeats